MAAEVLAERGARRFSSAEFLTSGLVWDQFFDANALNDVVDQYYNAGSASTKDEPASLGGGGAGALTTGQVTWTNVDGSAFVFNDAGTTTRCPSLVKECQGAQFFDGFNDVAWLNIGGCCTLGVTWFGISIDEADLPPVFVPLPKLEPGQVRAVPA